METSSAVGDILIPAPLGKEKKKKLKKFITVGDIIKRKKRAKRDIAKMKRNAIRRNKMIKQAALKDMD